jgi:hypothetical protein
MRITEPNIVVCCPHAVTGGPELLHQLVHALRQIGRSAHIAYYPFDQPFECQEPYRRYEAPQGPLWDREDVFVVVPETATWIIKRLRKARAGVWWMSVDTYYRVAHQSRVRDAYCRCLSLLKGRRPIFRLKNCAHFAQSRYAEVFLRRKGLNPVPLYDYLSDEHLARPAYANIANRQDIVVFNPRRAQKEMKVLVAAWPQIRFVPIEGLTPLQVAELLGRAKVYVDFGHHPGKDRLPREAAMAGCCVITGRRGAAAYSADIPIADRYKLDDGSRSCVREFGGMVQELLREYGARVRDFDSYRETILEEPSMFRKQVESIFGTSSR